MVVVELVLATSAAALVHPDTRSSLFTSVDEATLGTLVSEALADVPAGYREDLAELRGSLPESGFVVMVDGRLLAEPGCCSSLSGAIGFIKLLNDPPVEAVTVFTGHDVTSFVEVRANGSTNGVELVVSRSDGSAESFVLPPATVKDISYRLQVQVETAIGRTADALPADTDPTPRRSIAGALLGIDANMFW